MIKGESLMVESYEWARTEGANNLMRAIASDRAISKETLEAHREHLIEHVVSE